MKHATCAMRYWWGSKATDPVGSKGVGGVRLGSSSGWGGSCRVHDVCACVSACRRVCAQHLQQVNVYMDVRTYRQHGADVAVGLEAVRLARLQTYIRVRTEWYAEALDGSLFKI
jgi:hypothetical protein